MSRYPVDVDIQESRNGLGRSVYYHLCWLIAYRYNNPGSDIPSLTEPISKAMVRLDRFCRGNGWGDCDR